MPYFKFPDSGGGGGLLSLLIQNTVFVAKNGNDATGVRNDWNHPFKTVNAGLLAALAGDTVFVFGGIYDESIFMPDKNNIIIEGAGQKNTIIAPSTPFAQPFKWVPVAAGMTKFVMRNLKLQSPGGIGIGTCCILDGSGVADFGSDGIVLQNVEMDEGPGGTRTLLATRVGNLRVNLCPLTGAASELLNCGNVVMLGVTAPAFLNTFDGANPLPPGGRQQYVYEECMATTPSPGTGLGVTGAPILVWGCGSVCFGNLGALALAVTGAFNPILIIRGALLGATHLITFPSPTSVIDLSESELHGNIKIVTLAAPVRVMVNFANATFHQLGGPGDEVGLDNFMDGNLKGAAFPSMAIFTPGIGADRPGFRRETSFISSVPVGPGPTVLPFVHRWPPLGPIPTVAVTSQSAAGVNAVSAPAVTTDAVRVDSVLADIVEVVLVDSA